MPDPTRRALVGGGLATGGLATLSAAGAMAEVAAPARPRVVLSTGAGSITVELAIDKAPLTGANFLRYVDARRLDGSRFYRSMRIAPEPLNGLIQGGLGGLPVRTFPPVAHESTIETGLRHLDGTISLAREAPGTARCDFFICIGPVPSLDADPTAPGDNLGFAAFGQVTDGMDVVRKILLSPLSPTLGEGPMKGEMLDPTIPILTARRT
jgi:peptidyl-prolyl cis-trans isomerase A (cyclophilin A)